MSLSWSDLSTFGDTLGTIMFTLGTIEEHITFFIFKSSKKTLIINEHMTDITWLLFIDGLLSLSNILLKCDPFGWGKWVTLKSKYVPLFLTKYLR